MSFIETERLFLRAWMPDDEETMIPIFADPETMRYIGMGYQRGFRPDETRALIKRMSDHYDRTGLGIWPVVVKETGAIVGECGLYPVKDSNDVELAYLFGRQGRGQGYALEAARAVAGYAFDVLALPRIVAFVHPGNTRSVALINRLGMRFDGLVRMFRADVLHYVKERA